MLTKIDGTRLKFREERERNIGYTTVKAWRAMLPKKIVRYVGIGVDPGRNFGIASLTRGQAWVVVGEMNKEDAQWKYGIEAYDIMAGSTPLLFPKDAVIERAFENVPGASNLIRIEQGFLYGAYYMGKTVNIVPPNKIRKAVLGYGKVNTDVLDDLWGLPDHGSDAFVIACYAAGVSLSVPENVRG